MLEVVQMPLARRMWRISKLFQLPLSDERMQDMNSFDLEFYELSMIADDPKKLQQLKERYYDPEFDEWMEEFDLEQSEKSSAASNSGPEAEIDMPDEETIGWASKQQQEQNLPTEEYEVSEPTEITDWEEVKE